eukprot:s7201_g5.t1
MVVFTCEPNWFDPLDRVWVAAEVISPLGESVYFMLTLIERQPLRVHFEDASLQVGQALTLLNFGTATDDSLNCLFEEDDSHWFIRHASRADGVFRVRGLCAGFGALGRGVQAAGFTLVAQHEIEASTAEVLRANTHAPVIQGELFTLDTLMRLWKVAPGPAGIVSGISSDWLAGYSALGTQSDPKSDSLKGTLLAGHLLQAPWMLVGAAASAADHPWVRELLEGFCSGTGFRVSEVCLDFKDVWVSMREHWWCLLLAPELGNVSLTPWRADHQFTAVEQVLNNFSVGPSATAQLELSTPELEQLCLCGPLSSCILRLNCRLQVALRLRGSSSFGRSWGSLHSCQSCVESGFSVIVPIEEGSKDGFRFLHPAELAVICGVSPNLEFGKDLRAGLSLVCRAASPLQSVWLLAQLRGAFQHCGNTADPLFTTLRPAHILLSDLLRELIDESIERGLLRIPVLSLSQTAPSAWDESMSDIALGWPQVEDRTLGSHRLNVVHAATPIMCPHTILLGALLDGLFLRTGLVVTQATNEAGHLLPRRCLVDADTRLDLFGPWIRPASLGLQAVFKTAVDLQYAIAPSMPPVIRLALLRQQGQWVADDQFAFALAQLVTMCPCKVVTIDPLQATQALSHQAAEWLPPLPAASSGVWDIVTAVCIRSHWVTFHWHSEHGRIQAWASESHPEVSVGIDVMHCLIARATAHHQKDFVFSTASQLPGPPGTCGRQALLLLACQLQVHTSALECLLDDLFVRSIQHATQVRAPLMLGGVLQAMFEHGLSSLLRQKGVPEACAVQRAQQAIARLGAANIQHAMQSSQPWRQLKQLANQCSPPFQWILPSELQQQVDQRVAAGQQLPPRKKGGPRRKEGTIAAPAAQCPPTPDQFQVPPGVFVSGELKLSQIQLSEVGPHSSGVVLASFEDAQPYISLGRPVSDGPLAVLVLGEVPGDKRPQNAVSVRFQAECVPSGAPALLNALLVQLGTSTVSKHCPSTHTHIEIVESAVLRLSVYRDMWPGAWDLFTHGPIKSVIDQCAQLRSCDQLECECPCWHGLRAPKDPEAILEVWGRHFSTMQFRTCSADQADVFSAFLRVPLALQEKLLKAAGGSGIFFEPRDGDSKQPSSAYSVVWIPKGTLQEVTLLKQTHAHALGIARVGLRFGVRCLKAQEESLHKELRPATPFIGGHGARSYHAGPFPFGVQRSAIVKALAAFGWAVKPLQPVPGGTGPGTWWAIQAASEPPSQVLHFQHGEIIITCQPARTAVASSCPPVVAAKSTLQTLVATTSGGPSPAPMVDPLQTEDPWSLYLASKDKNRKQVGGQPLVSAASAPPKPQATSLTQQVQVASSDIARISAHIEHQVLAKVQQQVDAATGALGQKVT